MTHYEVLQVMPSARPEVIDAAYKAQVRLLHPDVNPGHEDIVMKLNEAHRVLRDPKLREAYDATLAEKPGDVIGGKYRIQRKIATGGFGTTYLAEHIALPGSMVCIKQASRISPKYEKVLANEATAMWDLRHHAIPAIRDYLRLDNGSVALVMSYIPGPTLHALVEQNGPIVPEDVAWITERMLNALQYLHFHGVIHGDLKPLNVIVDEEKHECTLVDFGLVSVRPEATTKSYGETPLFTPPEIKKGFPPIPQTDFYSLGATMIFALTGDLAAVKDRKVPSTVPDALSDFMRRLLHWKPLERPDWSSEDLMNTFADVRQKSFGRRYSNMHPIRYVNQANKA